MHSLVFLVAAVYPVVAHRYALKDEIVGEKFFHSFRHESIPDPTHGRVEYVDDRTARQLNLSYATEDHFIMRADHSTRLDSWSTGRKSVRILSNDAYSHGTVLVADIEHMPTGCGTWPAFWTVGDTNWPYKGEIDILEGVNDVSPNMVSLHTSEGCKQPSQRAQKGSSVNRDCNAFVNYNSGCNSKVNNQFSYGPSFNAMGGGWYALERTRKEIKVWFWPRNDATVPAEVASRYHHSRGLIQAPIVGDIPLGGHHHHPDTIHIDTSTWGVPDALFVDDQCDIPSHFKEHHIVINLTFCGDWAGEFFTYRGSGCPGSCVDYVNSNPEAFKDAYWDIRGIRVFAKPEEEENYQDWFVKRT
ncbi:Probable glycosidase C21B10.07 [Serendipita indica DSM 11827]|nr:Probable glycosidase C21B10.07 [Serendipita indica DSM 11827]